MREPDFLFAGAERFRRCAYGACRGAAAARFSSTMLMPLMRSVLRYPSLSQTMPRDGTTCVIEAFPSFFNLHHSAAHFDIIAIIADATLFRHCRYFAAISFDIISRSMPRH